MTDSEIPGIFQTWLKKTKGFIPVAVYCPEAGGYQEVYVKAPVKASTVEFIPHLSRETAYVVAVSLLVPTARRLHAIGETSMVVRRPYDYPTKTSLERYMTLLPGAIDFTLEELRAGLGRNIEAELHDEKTAPILQKSTAWRKCTITGEEAPTYKLRGMQMRQPPIYTIQALKDFYKTCTKCSLGIARRNRGIKETCQGRGKPDARGLIIGEAPGRVEEETGLVFHPSAPAGRILARAMTQAGTTQDEWYIDNAVCCRPLPKEMDTYAENGKPEAEHLTACSTRLKTLVLLLKPKVVVLLGAYAYAAWYGHHPQKLGPATGWQPDKWPKVYVMYHPAYYARKAQKIRPDQRKRLAREYVEEWKKIVEVLHGNQ